MRPWQSVIPAAIRRRGASHRKKTDSHDQFANCLGMTKVYSAAAITEAPCHCEGANSDRGNPSLKNLQNSVRTR